nr:tetratricopeptide repeat protein [Methylomarinum sp. Ch1-1]MDP4519842.1 tetratricopeptide repeat protein [Methylomarinum sp. Ch1-1]
MININKFCLFAIVAVAMAGCTQNVRHPPEAGLKKSGDILTLLDPETKTEQQALAKAENALREGNTEVARFYFAKALQFNNKNVHALEQIAAIHGRNGNHELAAKIYKQILAIDSSNQSANEKLGLYALKNGRVESAKQFLSKAVLKTDTHWRSHNGLGIIADLDKDYVSAIYHYQAALNVQPNNPLLLNNLGYSYYLSGNLAKAKEFFNYALRFDHQYERAIHNLALIEIKHNAFANAYALFNRVMKPYEAWNNIGYLCMINEQYGPAEKFLRRAISESPVYFPKAHENLKTLVSLKKA